MNISWLMDFIRGTKMPVSGTSEQWADWHKKASTDHPWRYWVVEEFLEDIVYACLAPSRWLYECKSYIRNRFFTRSHILRTNLPKGKWHEFEDRILHGLFEEFVNFVEIEQAWHNVVLDRAARKKFKVPFFRWRWRCAESGIEYLEWASKLTHDDDVENSELTDQAICAKETLVLYNWWKNDRPQRVDPSFLITEKFSFDGPLNDKLRAQLDKHNEIEVKYIKEDDEMLTRLIKIRRGLWT